MINELVFSHMMIEIFSFNDFLFFKVLCVCACVCVLGERVSFSWNISYVSLFLSDNVSNHLTTLVTNIILGVYTSCAFGACVFV